MRNSRHNIEKSGVVGHLDLPGGRLPKEEDTLRTLTVRAE